MRTIEDMSSDQSRKRDRHKKKPLQLRLHESLREQLEKLAERNLTTLTAEITAAIRERLIANDLWPPSRDQAENGKSSP